MSAPAVALPYTPANPEEIRPLPVHIPQMLRERALNELNDALEDGKLFALVSGLDMDGARLAVMARHEGAVDWSFSGYLAHAWGGPSEVGVKVVVAF